jgi:amino acid adenylation domain-containing protein
VGQTEETLARLWAELLGLERIGRHDNFFELGGHSLLIVQMLERLRRAGMTAKVREVYESPTLADLAKTLTREIEQFEVPPNRIPAGTEVITPQMLPLADLEPQQIQQIVRNVPGGAENVQDIYPLAPLQEGILFHHLLDEQGGDTYVLPMLLSVESKAKLEELTRALQAVIDRHDVLRTAVLWEGLPRPLQVVYRRAALPVKQLRLDSERDPLEQLKERMRPEHQRLDLRAAPLMQLQIAVDLNGSQWYALLQLHHLVCDNKSLVTLLAELMAYLEGREVELPEPMPYRNHVAHALTYARSSDAEAYFRAKLGDISEPTVPFGLLDVHGVATRIESHSEPLDLTLSKRVRTQSRRFGVSAATVFHAAWALVVARTSGRDDVVFGSVLLGHLQGSAGAQPGIGMFINTLPLRVQLNGLTARTLVEETQRGLIELLNYEQVSLADVQQCSRLSATDPLFTALLNYRHSAADFGSKVYNAPGIQLIASQSWTNYPLMLSVDDLGSGFALGADVDKRIDARRVIGYMHASVQSLVDALEREPQRPALNLLAMRESDRKEVLQLFNATATPYRQDRSVPELFGEQARSTPGAAAVVHAGEVWTYAQLNEGANQLARYLRDRGVRPEGLVGVCLDRGSLMVMALLGILKAGGAYIPLDPNYPAERLQYMLKDAAPRLVLTQTRVAVALPQGVREIVRLDEKLEEIRGYSPSEVVASEVGVSAEHLIYVIYTSGSTGRPKGTAMAHRSMVNLIEWHRRSFGSGAGQRVLQFAALSFDVAFQEVFTTLCTGGTLVLLDEWVRPDAHALMHLLRSQSVTRLFVPPLMLQTLAEHARSSGVVPESLRDVITAGEQLRISAEIVEFFRGLPGCRLHNHYGPTETHVVTALTLAGECGGWPSLPSIGRPIANAQIYIVDERRQPVPIGVAGEIYIGGAGVARGYLSRPDLTEQRFLPDSFSPEPQARMYKTGDLGRWRADGTIEYLGRNDDQVKIRGFRIELGEIEAQLTRHEQVREAAVVAREEESGQKRLIAYLTRRGERELSVENMREHLKALLPEYMVPSAFMVLEKLPLTSSGKLDRRALPAPDLEAYIMRQYEPPRGEVEEVLARIWQDLLHVERIGRHDNFFELGGHSIMAVRMVARARSLYYGLTLKHVYTYKTLTLIADHLDKDPGSAQIAIQHSTENRYTSTNNSNRDTLDLNLIGVQSIGFYWQYDKPSHDLTGKAFELHDKIDRRAFSSAVLEIINNWDVFKISFSNANNVWRMKMHSDFYARDTTRIIQFKECSESDLDLTFNELYEKSVNSFDLTNNPLIRFIVTSTHTGSATRIAVLMHHALADEISCQILISNLIKIYAHYAGSRTPYKLPQPTSMADYVAWLSSRLHSPDLDEKLMYWSRSDKYIATLKDSNLALLSGQSRQSEDYRTKYYSTVTTTIDSPTTKQLSEHLGSSHGIRLEVGVPIIVLHTLYRFLPNQPIHFWFVDNGRNIEAGGPDTSNLIGMIAIPLILFCLPGKYYFPTDFIREQKKAFDFRSAVDYFSSAYFSEFDIPEERKLLVDQVRRLPRPEISFNFLGEISAHAQIASLRPIELTRLFSPENRFFCSLDVRYLVENGKLTIHFRYNTSFFTTTSMNELICGVHKCIYEILQETRTEGDLDV